MKLKRMIALVLCLLMVIITVACGNGSSDSNADNPRETSTPKPDDSTDNNDDQNSTPDYLNVGGSLPLVKEGYERSLKIAFNLSPNAGTPEDMWAYKFVTDSMNINLEVEAFTGQNRAEYISLAFAGNQLPDAIIGGGLTADELMMYGSQEGQLLDLSPYLNDTFMPNLYALYQENPDWKNAIMNSNGQVYSIGYINEPSDQGQISRMFYNYDWLDELGIDVPKTLDEYVSMLRAFKTLGDDIIPIGGAYNANNSTLGILNALGYNTTNAKGLSIALRNSEVVLPVADPEVYGVYLTLMNTLYTEGLLAQDFYTADATTVQAYMAEGRNGVIAQAPFVFTDKYNEWWGAVPLTSEYNDTQFWPSSAGALTAGQFVVNSKCESPELAAVFADWFFDEHSLNYTMFTNGAHNKDTEHLYDTLGWEIIDDESRSLVHHDYENNKDSYASRNDLLVQKIQLIGYRVLGYGYWSTVGTWSYQLLQGYPWDECISGYPDIENYTGDTPIRHTITYNETHFRMALKDTLVEHVVESYPTYVYFEPETSVSVSNLATIINEYAEQESAKFITGARPLEELDSYFNEIQRLGAEEYVQYYKDYYENLKSN